MKIKTLLLSATLLVSGGVTTLSSTNLSNNSENNIEELLKENTSKKDTGIESIVLNHSAENDLSSKDIVINYSLELSDSILDVQKLELWDDETKISTTKSDTDMYVEFLEFENNLGSLIVHNVTSTNHYFKLYGWTTLGGVDSNNLDDAGVSNKLTVSPTIVTSNDLVEFNVVNKEGQYDEANLSFEIKVDNALIGNINPIITKLKLGFIAQDDQYDTAVVELSSDEFESSYDSDSAILTYSGQKDLNYDELGLKRNKTYDFNLTAILENPTELQGDNGVVFNKTTSLYIPKDAARPIDSSAIDLSVSDTTPDSLTYHYDINLSNDQNEFEDTEILKVELIDENGNVIETNDDNKTSGDFVINSLAPHESHKYGVRVTTNAFESDGKTQNIIDSEMVEGITSLLPAQPISEEDIEINVSDISGSSANINYNITMPQNSLYEPTTIEHVMLIDNSTSEAVGENLTSASGTFEVNGLEINNSYTYKLFIATNANEISKNVTFDTVQGQPMPITANDITLNETMIDNNVVKIDYKINDINALDVNDDYIDTEIVNVELLDSEGELINSNDDGSLSGEFTIGDLNLADTYSYKLRVTTNSNSNTVEKESSFETNVGPVIQIDENDIEIEAIDIPSNGENKATISWNTTLPTDPKYSETIVEEVTVFDGDEELVRDVRYTDKHGVSGSVTISNIEFGVEHNYKIGVKTNAGDEYVKSDETINVFTDKADPIQITSADIELEAHQPAFGTREAAIDWNINLPSDEAHNETIVEDIKLYNNGAEVTKDVEFTNKTSTTGTITVSNLEVLVENNYSIGVKTNAGDEYVESELVQITANALEPIQIHESDIEITTDLLPKGEQEVTIDWNVDLPIWDGVHDTTYIEDIKLYDEDKEVVDNVEFTDKTSPTGSVTISNLEFGVTHYYKIGVKTNAGDEYVLSSKLLRVQPEIGDAVQIESDNINLKGHDATYGNNDAIIDWNIDLPNDSKHEETSIEDIRLYEDGSRITDGIEFTDKTSPTGTITIHNLEHASVHSYTVKVKTNVDDKYIESDNVVVQAGFENTLETHDPEDYNYDFEKSQLTFYLKVLGNPDLLQIKYKDDSSSLELKYEVEPTKSNNSIFKYTIQFEENKNYNLNEFKISKTGGESWENLTFDMLTSDNPDSDDNLGFDISSDGTVTNFNGEETGYKFIENNGHINISDSDGKIIEPEFKTNPENKFPWLIVTISTITIIGLIALLAIFLRRKYK